MKLFKLFLVVAIATLGLSSIANAKSLSEAIEGTDISGKITYKMSKTTKSEALPAGATDLQKAQRTYDAEGSNKINFNVKLKIPTGEKSMVVANVEQIGDRDYSTKVKTDESKDSAAKAIQLNTLYFQTKPNAKTTVAYGMFDQHEGLKASYNLGMMTIGTHYWYNTDAGVNDEIALALTKIKAGPATMKLVYQMSTDVDKNISQKTTYGKLGTPNNKDEGWNKLNFNVAVPAGPAAISFKYLSKSVKASKTVNGKKDIKTGTEIALGVGYKANGASVNFVYMSIGKMGGISDGNMGIDTDGTYDRGTPGEKAAADALAGGSAMNLKVAYALPMITPSLSYTVKSLGSDFKKTVKDSTAKYTDDTDIKLAFAHKLGKAKSSFYYSTSTGNTKSAKNSETGIVLSYKF